MALQHLRSGTANKRPLPTAMSDGQLAVNTNLASPGLFFKDSNGDLVKAGPVHVGTTAPNASPASTAATALVANTIYKILTVGTSDFTSVGAGSNAVGVVFTASGTTTGTGTVSGEQGNEKGEQWLDTTNSLYVMKVYDGTGWRVTNSISLANGTAAAPSLHFGSDTNTGLFRSAADSLAITTAGTQRVTVDSSGRLLVGTSSARTVYSGGIQVESLSNANLNLVRNATGATQAAAINISRSRGSSVGSNTAVQSGDDLGFINFTGADGTDIATEAAQIRCQVDGTPGSNDMPGRLMFSTTADGASSPSERMRIDSAGNVGIGTDLPRTNLDVLGGVLNTSDTIDTNNQIRIGVNKDVGFQGILSYGQPAVNNLNSYALSISAITNNNNANILLAKDGGNVGIGLNDPGKLLHLSSDDPQMRFTDTSTGVNFDINANSSVGNVAFNVDQASASSQSSFVINCRNSEKFRIVGTTGKVGIGTSSPGSNLEVVANTVGIKARATGNTAANMFLDSNRGVGVIGGQLVSQWNSSAVSAIRFVNGDDAVNKDNGHIAFSTASAGSLIERMRITSAGNVGIGSSSPAANLDILVNSASDSEIRVRNSTDGMRLMTQADGSSLIRTVFNRGLIFGSGTSNTNATFTERMRIDSSGNVGIGTTSPSQPLDVVGWVKTSVGLLGTTGRVSTQSGGINISTGATANPIIFTGGTGSANVERMRIDTSGNVRIGQITGASAKLSVYGSQCRFQGAGTGTGESDGFGIGNNGATDSFIWNYENGFIQIGTNNTERMRIDSSGRLLVGTSSEIVSGSPASSLHMANGSGGKIYLMRDDSGSTVAGNDLGMLRFYSNDGGAQESARIGAQADLAHATNDKPGRLVFSTTADGAASPTERLRIDSSGNVGIGTTSPGGSATAYDGGLLHINQSAGSKGSQLRLTNTVTGTGAGDGSFISAWTDNGLYITNQEAAGIHFSNNGVERMRIDSSGNVGIGTTITSWFSGSDKLVVRNNSNTGTSSAILAIHDQALQYPITCWNASSGSTRLMLFRIAGAGNGVGTITSNGSSTSYNTSSDYRLKENVVNIANGITRVKQLKPRRFNFIIDAETTVDGFVAHEAQAVVPEAVTGEKDGEEMQGIDQAKLVPLLTAALQEAITKIETLEQRLSDAGIA